MKRKCEEPHNKLIVSEIQITPIKPQNGLVGFASCVLNNQVYLGCIAIHCDLLNQSFRCVYPTKKLKSGQDIPVFHPISREAGEAIQRAIIIQFENFVKREFF